MRLSNQNGVRLTNLDIGTHLGCGMRSRFVMGLRVARLLYASHTRN